MMGDLLWAAVVVCAPILGLTMLVGILVSVVQVVTQVQEMSLTFVPKLLAAALALLLFGPWMLRALASYTMHLWSSIPSIP